MDDDEDEDEDLGVVAAFPPGAGPAGQLTPADSRAAGSAQRPLVGPPASRDVRLAGSRQEAEDVIQDTQILREDEQDFAVRFTVPGSKRMHVLGDRGLVLNWLRARSGTLVRIGRPTSPWRGPAHQH